MAWVEFVDDFDWNPPELGGRVTKAFRKGQVLFVRRAGAAAAIASGKARPTTNPNRRAGDEFEEHEGNAGRR